MRRTILLTITALFLGGIVLGADRQGKGNKHHGEPAATSGVAVSVSWGTHDVEVVRRYYAPKYRNLPPGLQKKYARTGQLPPGWQKKMEPLAAAVERECTPLPAGYRRGVIDAHAVIYNSHGTIFDVAVLF
jgi:hypothetical protein